MRAISTFSSRSSAPPVGLAGEFRMTIRVCGVSRSARSSAVNAKPVSSVIGSGTAVAPDQLIADS